MRLYSLLSAFVILCISGCGNVVSGDRYVVMPRGVPGPLWQGREFVWEVRWEGSRRIIEPDTGVYICAGYLGPVTAQALTPEGLLLGYPAGRIIRDAMAEPVVELLYEYGWVASVVLIAAEGGMEYSRINTGRLQYEAGEATGGRRFLLDHVHFAQALAYNTLTARSFQADVIDLPPDIEGWSLHYPPQPGMPAAVREGLHLIWHPVFGVGWLHAAPDQVVWGSFALFDYEVNQFIRDGNNFDN